jgi:hypothetical protein
MMASPLQSLARKESPMRIVLLMAVGALGCASPERIDRGANEHLAKARVLEANGDYSRAQKERLAADRQFAKARDRSDWWY